MTILIFQGMEVHGIPDYVLTRGRVAFAEGRARATSGSGRFVETAPYAPAVYARTPARDAARAWKRVRNFVAQCERNILKFAKGGSDAWI